jgi:hypothetical protein
VFGTLYPFPGSGVKRPVIFAADIKDNTDLYVAAVAASLDLVFA